MSPFRAGLVVAFGFICFAASTSAATNGVYIYNDATHPMYISGGTGGTVTTVPTGITITQTTVTLTAATSGTLIAANANRKYLQWMNTGANPMTVAPGAGPAVVNTGMNYNGNSGTGTQGGAEDFKGGAVSTGAFAAISTLGTTVTVWEGQ